jgi:cbb3-type cytochrome c oxidase subunit III
VSLARNTVKPLLAALCAVMLALPLAACGREEEADLPEGKAQFVQKCGSCHALNRAGTQGNTGPNLDDSFAAALADGMDRDTVKGIVESQIAHPRKSSTMPAGLVKGQLAADVASYVAYASGRTGEDQGALAEAGLGDAKTGEQIFTAAGCGGCHTFGAAGSQANIGPNLDELAAAAGDRKPGTSAEDYVRESILQPQEFQVEGFGGAMPSYEGRLSDKQLDALTEYLLNPGG